MQNSATKTNCTNEFADCRHHKKIKPATV